MVGNSVSFSPPPPPSPHHHLNRNHATAHNKPLILPHHQVTRGRHHPSLPRHQSPNTRSPGLSPPTRDVGGFSASSKVLVTDGRGRWWHRARERRCGVWDQRGMWAIPSLPPADEHIRLGCNTDAHAPQQQTPLRLPPIDNQRKPPKFINNQTCMAHVNACHIDCCLLQCLSHGPKWCEVVFHPHPSAPSFEHGPEPQRECVYTTHRLTGPIFSHRRGCRCILY